MLSLGAAPGGWGPIQTETFNVSEEGEETQEKPDWHERYCVHCVCLCACVYICVCVCVHSASCILV